MAANNLIDQYMTHEEFIEMLDEEIEFCEPRAKDEEFNDRKADGYWTGHLNLLRRIKEKFFTLTPPPTTLS